MVGKKQQEVLNAKQPIQMFQKQQILVDCDHSIVNK